MAAKKLIIPTNTKRDLWMQIGIVALLSLIIVLVFFFIYLPWTTNHGESITVPDLKGMKLDEMEAYLAERDLRYEVQDSAFDLDLPPLSVKEQYPKAGSKVKEGRKIYLTVIAKNPRMIAMPRLVDLSERSAVMTLKQYKLEAIIAYKPYLGQVVLEQSVPPGERVAEGSKVKLVVGDGENDKPVMMPNLVGKTLAEVEFEIAGNNLVIGSKLTATDTEQPPGTVAKQNPAAGTEVRAGDIVDIWVVPGAAPPGETTNENVPD